MGSCPPQIFSVSIGAWRPCHSPGAGSCVLWISRVVARAGSQYHIAVAAEMDFYPKYLPWAFVTPSIAGAREDGKLLIDLPWDGEASRFLDVIATVVLYRKKQMDSLLPFL